MSKIYLDGEIFNLLQSCVMYNQSLGETIKRCKEIKLSPQVIVKKLQGLRVPIFMGYDIPNRHSEFCIKYGIKKNDAL